MVVHSDIVTNRREVSSEVDPRTASSLRMQYGVADQEGREGQGQAHVAFGHQSVSWQGKHPGRKLWPIL